MLYVFCFSTINGRIDQVNQLLELDHQKRGGARYTALDKWTNQLNSLNQAIVSKLAWLAAEDPQTSSFTTQARWLRKGCQWHKLFSGLLAPNRRMTWSVCLNWLICVMRLQIFKPQLCTSHQNRNAQWKSTLLNILDSTSL